MDKTLEQLKLEMINSAKRGYPILISGSIYFFILTFAPLLFSMETVYLIWIIGLGVIFPFGLLIGKMLGVNVITKNNPLGNLGGIVAATQAFYIPVFIMVYMNNPGYLPFTIGLLGGAHFLPYMWIYNSKAYLFITLATCLSAFFLGGLFIDFAFILVPLAISIIYGIGVLWMLKENKKDEI
jgi:hypothetical protein